MIQYNSDRYIPEDTFDDMSKLLIEIIKRNSEIFEKEDFTHPIMKYKYIWEEEMIIKNRDKK